MLAPPLTSTPYHREDGPPAALSALMRNTVEVRETGLEANDHGGCVSFCPLWDTKGGVLGERERSHL